MVGEEEMKCPSCGKKLRYKYRQRGMIRTHEEWYCDVCRLVVNIHQLVEPEPSLLEKLGRL